MIAASEHNISIIYTSEIGLSNNIQASFYNLFHTNDLMTCHVWPWVVASPVSPPPRHGVRHGLPHCGPRCERPESLPWKWLRSFLWQEKLWKGPFYNNPLLVHWWKYVEILVKPNMILWKFMEYIYFLSSCFCSWGAHEPSKLRLAHVGPALDTPLFITCHHLPKAPLAIQRDIP